MIKCCKNCNDRELGCHSKCKKYEQEKRELEQEKEMMRKDSLYGKRFPNRTFD